MSGVGFPKIFRILVIDDQICSDSACQKQVENDSGHVKALIRRYFTSVVHRTVLEQISKGIIKAGIPEIEVDFAKDPDEGVRLWMESVYDLTLVDSDFSRDETMKLKIDERHKRNFLDLKLEFTGAYLYRFLCDMMSGKEFSNVRKGCRIGLWTGLGLVGEGKPDRAKRLISILPRSDEGLCFIPKKEGDISGWLKIGLAARATLTIEGIIDVMKKDNPVLNPDTSFDDDKAKSAAIIGRIKGLYRVKQPKEFASLCGFDEQVYVGWLKSEGDGAVLYDERIDGGISLSPLLRCDEDIDDCMVKDGDSEDVKKRKEIDAKRLEALTKNLLVIREGKDEKGIVVPGAKNQTEGEQKRKKQIIAAATPLTGCSAVNENYAKELMQKKIRALLNGPFEEVVLKTVYLDSLDQWDNLHWPTLQAQSHHRTRCLRSTIHPRTLWNTGITALESFKPEMMHKFLSEFATDDAEMRKHTIVSLGSKYPQWDLNERIQKRNKEIRSMNANDGVTYRELELKHYRDHAYAFPNCIVDLENDLEEVWKNLFQEVYSDELKGGAQYPIVEINVRHYLRECVAYHLGGHEYLSPAKIDPDHTKNELDFTGCYRSLDLEFGSWLKVLDKTAKDFGKNLLLKLPFRGDVLHFIRLIRDYVNTNSETSITGITLINAFKSGVGETTPGGMYTPAWYGNPEAWGDASGRQWTYQMSGEALTASRNELMGEVFRLVANSKLEVHVSGGIVDVKGIRYCSPAVVRTKDCVGCQNCINLCKSNAISIVEIEQTNGVSKENKAEISSLTCKSCGECVDNCPIKAITKPKVQIGTWALMDLNLDKQNWNVCSKTPPAIGIGKPRIDKCQNCKPCSVKCDHGAFKKEGNTFAQIDYGCCVDCKECVVQCVHGAVTIGQSASSTTLHAMEFDEKGKRRINPRIAFCLHELCNGCGKCSRTFYCDTFMDRQGLKLPPVMDSRNCTGCGLCAQTCPRGAIQLFSPEHVVALIGAGDSLTAWHRRLTAYEIPHLVFSEDEVKKYYAEWEEESHSQNMEEMFKHRITNDLFFDKLSPDDYTDDRNWNDFFSSVLEKKVTDNDIIQKWLFLAWSDPGQVLKDSPIIYAKDNYACYYFFVNNPKVNQPEDLNKSDCGLLIEDVLGQPGMTEINTEVNKRLNNLREDK